MADVARSPIVSKESHNGLLVDDSVKNSPSGDSNDLTECSASNHTNSCNGNSFSADSAQGYQEIESLSDLSFPTSDDVSLQDIMESEFAARIARTIDDCWSPSESSGLNKTNELFEEIFESYSKKKLSEENVTGVSRGKDFIASVGDDIVQESSLMMSNLDDFISGPLQGCTSLITSSTEEEPKAEPTKSVNIFKLDRPDDIPIMTNFDPFTAIEEDSENSNPLSCSNVLNSPDEFPFPESPQETKVVEKAEDTSNKEYPEKSEDQNDDLFVNKPEETVMRDFFSKTVSDENLESFVEQNYEENDGSAKFHVVNNMSSVESVNSSFPNASSLTSPEKNDVDEFFSSEDMVVENLGVKIEEVSDGLAETTPAENHVQELFPPRKVELFIDDETGDEFEDFPAVGETRGDQENGDLVKTKKFVCEQEEWTTVEEALKAEPEDFELEGDSSVLNVTNQCVKTNNFVGVSTNDVSGLTNSQVNGLSESDSESDPSSESDKKTTKKKKSKKGKKSDEKENISVEQTQNGTEKPTPPVSSSTKEGLEDLSNVSVKNLMLTYSSEVPKYSQKRWSSKDTEPVPIQKLKARSMVDLTSNSKRVDALRLNLFENAKNVETSRSTTNLSNTERHPVVTGVSVRALKSSFSKFDQLSKKTILHVRSVDTTKVQKQFNEASTGSAEITCNCKSCGKQVFQMEQIKAEKSVWHKNCFRCKECNKQLSVDTYSSHEGCLYCKPHFRELFKPKAVIEDETEPASDKPDLGLEELASLNVKSRYQVFERTEENTANLEKSASNVNVKRSASILSKLAKFQKKGMDVGVRDEELNGLPIEQSSSSSEEEEEEEEEEETVTTKKVVKSKKVRERPISFSKMGDVKSVWESGVPKTREEMREERNKEIHQIRSKLFMGKQVKMKEAYEQAVRESETVSPRKSVEVRSEKAKSIKECFEKGEPLNVDDDEEAGEEKKKVVEDDMSLFEAGISKKSRSLFLELDKSAKNQQTGPPIKKPSSVSPTTPRSQEMESPEKEIYRDPNVVRASDKVEQEIIRTNTTAKMLSLFRQMEEKTEEVPDGPKPLKRFTPPPDYKEESDGESEETEESEEEEEEEEEVNPNIIRASDKVEDEYLKQAASAARAKQLRAKFEKWEEKEKEREREELMERKMNGSANIVTENSENVEVTSIECTKSLRARFESMKGEAQQPKEKVLRPKVNRFVHLFIEEGTTIQEEIDSHATPLRVHF